MAGTFHALHQLLETDEAASEREHEHEHEHDYRAEAVVRGSPLPESGMLLDLDLLREALTACLSELDTTDLGALPAFRGRNTTVEVVAGHIWEHVRAQLGGVAPLGSLRVTVYETADAWAAIDRPLVD